MVCRTTGYTERKSGDKAFIPAVGLQDLSLERLLELLEQESRQKESQGQEMEERDWGLGKIEYRICNRVAYLFPPLPNSLAP